MKMPISCLECQVKELEQGNRNEKDTYYDLQNVNDSGIYVYECPNGHKITALLQNWKYEVLFEMGINAYRDEYYREAVVNFATALERFYEYSIIVFCHHSNISKEEFNKMWKDVSNQSERQLGAYCFLYLQTLKKNPNLFKDKVVSFRNKVVHKGYIPSKEEALDYGKKVAEYIQYNKKLYEENFGCQELEKIQIEYLVNRSEIPESDHVQQMGFASSLLKEFEEVMKDK